MDFFKAFMVQIAAKLIVLWAIGCLVVGIILGVAIDNWHPRFDDHPWGIVAGCLAYFALIIPIVWFVRRKAAKP